MGTKSLAGGLSEKSKAALRGIADGLTYNQIVESGLGLTYHDIFAAAREALALAGDQDYLKDRIEEIREKYPNAYKPWAKGDDDMLKTLVSLQKSVSEIALHFRRQPSAIRSRIGQIMGPEANDKIVDETI